MKDSRLTEHPDGPPESEVIRRVLKGEREEYRHLVEAHQNRVYSMIMRQVREPELARELTQEVFIKAYSKLQQFRGDAAFSTWITQIALNETRNYFASKRYRQYQQTVSLENVEVGEHSGDSPERLQSRLRLKKLKVVMGDLSPKYREVFILCGLEQYTYEEAAETLGVPVGTIRSRLHQARLLLKKAISEKLS